MAKLKVDPNKCIGCGTCVALAGKTFKMNDSNKAQALEEPGDDKATIQAAIDSCPVSAISQE